MRLKHMALLGLLCMSANTWALMSKKCNEPKHKETMCAMCAGIQKQWLERLMPTTSKT